MFSMQNSKGFINVYVCNGTAKICSAAVLVLFENEDSRFLARFVFKFIPLYIYDIFTFVFLSELWLLFFEVFTKLIINKFKDVVKAILRSGSAHNKDGPADIQKYICFYETMLTWIILLRQFL